MSEYFTINCQLCNEPITQSGPKPGRSICDKCLNPTEPAEHYHYLTINLSHDTEKFLMDLTLAIFQESLRAYHEISNHLKNNPQK